MSWTGRSGCTGRRCSDTRQPYRAACGARRGGQGAAAGTVPRRASRGGHLAAGHLPKAWVGDQKIERPTLRGLLDDLEEMFPPDAQTPARGALAVTAGFDRRHAEHGPGL